MRPAPLRAQASLLSLFCIVLTFFTPLRGAIPGSEGFLYFSTGELAGLRSRVAGANAAQLMKRQELLLSQASPLPWKKAHRQAGLALAQVLSAHAGSETPISPELLMELLEVPTQEQNDGLPALTAEASTLYGVSLAFDLEKQSLTLSDRAKVALRLLRHSKELATRALIDEQGKAPDLETATALAAAGLAALAIQREACCAPEAEKQASACANAVRQVLAELGDHGWPRETFPSLRRALSHGLGAFMIAWKKQQKDDLFNTRYGRPWAALYATLLIPQARGAEGCPELPHFGPLSTSALSPDPSWGPSGQAGGDLLLLSNLADAGTRAALLWTHQRCFGSAEGDGSLDLFKGSDVLFAITGPLLTESPLNPAKAIPRVWVDEKAGVYIMRNRWLGPEDSVMAVHANPRPHPFIPSFADAGSFRLLALGGRWAVRRALDSADLAESAREKENVVVIPGTHGWLGGKVAIARIQTDGSASLTTNLDAIYTIGPPSNKGSRIVPTTDIGIRATRCIAVDYSGRSGAPILAVILDRIQNGPTRRWLMHTAEKGVVLRPNGFDLKTASGATLHATIICPERPRISVSEGVWTDTIAIDGEGNFMIIMTIQDANHKHPTVRVRGKDLESSVYLGNCLVRFDGEELAIR